MQTSCCVELNLFYIRLWELEIYFIIYYKHMLFLFKRDCIHSPLESMPAHLLYLFFCLQRWAGGEVQAAQQQRCGGAVEPSVKRGWWTSPLSEHQEVGKHCFCPGKEKIKIKITAPWHSAHLQETCIADMATLCRCPYPAERWLLD